MGNTSARHSRGPVTWSQDQLSRRWGYKLRHRRKAQAARSQARGGWARKVAGAGLYHEIPDVSRKKRK